MSVFKRGNVWWYTFRFRGARIQESTGSTSRNLAVRTERQRRTDLAEGTNNLDKTDKRPKLFSVRAKQYLEGNADWSESNLRIETYNVRHLVGHFGRKLLTDIKAYHISEYQVRRKKEAASPKTINNEVATLRCILRKARLWANIQPGVRMLKVRTDIGRALSQDEETRLLAACRKSRSRSLYPAVLLSIHSGLRNEELRLLRWRQVDMLERNVIVGKSKTSGGEGRTVPLSDTAWRCIQEWRSQWPEAKPGHYLFPSERYGFAGGDGPQRGTLQPYDVRPDVPMGSWKTAWTEAKKAAGVQCRWHDLRHTFVSRIAEGQVSDATIMSLAGHLSVKMKEKYSHTRTEAKRQAISILDNPMIQ